RVIDGTDFLAINPLGMVPVVRTDDGVWLTENAAILQYVAERFPAARLAPTGGIGRARLAPWLGLIGPALHKYTFGPLLHSQAPEEAKRYARTKAEPRLAYLNDQLKGREFLLDTFSVADAYLTTVLNWGRAMAIDLTVWPAVKDYFSRMR